MRRVNAAWTATVVSGTVCVGVSVFLIGGDDRRVVTCADLRLDAGEWRSHGPRAWERGESTRRREIAGDIIFCGTLRGDTKAQVEEQMGRPSGSRNAATWPFAATPSRRTDSIFGREQEVLVVRFGQAGRVTSVRLEIRETR